MGTEATTSVIPAVAPVQRSGRFALNLASNVAKLGITMVVGAWYVPFLVRQLGPAAYGLAPLASMITSYMGLITFSLDTAMGRYLTLSLARKDNAEAKKVFNVALWGNAAIVALLVIPATVAILNVQHLVHIPPGYESATRWLFAGTALAFFLNEIKIPFLAPCFALNRLDLQNVVVVAETLMRVGLVVFLFFLVGPRIEYVGAGILAGTVVSTLGAIWFWRKLTPALRVRLRDFDWTLLKSLSRTGGWVMVNQIGLLLYVNIDLLMANRLFGPLQGGRYAAVLALPILLRSLSIAVGEIFAPTMYRMYAREEYEAMETYLNRAIKFVGLVMALCVGLICGFSKPLLTLWLGPDFSDLASLLFLMAIALSLGLSMYPLFAVPIAANRVKVPGLVTMAVGLVNLALVFLLAKVAGWGLYGIAAAGAISLILRQALFVPLYGAIVLQRRIGTFYRQAIPITVATAGTIGLCGLISWLWTILNWVELGMAAAAVSLIYAVATWWLLDSGERAALKEAVIRWRE